ncbi:MAG: M13 family metallopeptidase N-terminal domain-containing protein [Bryobacteraceae bacterium]
MPGDQSTWGRFTELRERNQRNLRDILETSTAKAARSSVEQKIGDYYGTCMDEKTIEAKGASPLKSHLDRLNFVREKKYFTDVLIAMHTAQINVMLIPAPGRTSRMPRK